MGNNIEDSLYCELAEKKLNSSLIFEGSILKLYFDEVKLPNGKTATREKVSHPGAVAVVPVNKNNEVILVKQYRYPIEDVLIEIPAGKLDKNEPTHICAERELHEEAGAVDGKLDHLLTIYTSPGFSDEKMEIYIATGFKEKDNKPDHDEFLSIIKVSMKKCIDMISKGEITDAKTIIGILSAKEYLKKKKQK
ncbi:MAG: NUDIX hydrolase [Actinobacteria bacterium]|nr:NUDIX hydrolase [Actinomycetota bacterium]